MTMTSTEFARRLKLANYRAYMKQNIIYLYEHIAPHGSLKKLADILGISYQAVQYYTSDRRTAVPKNYACCHNLLNVFTEKSLLDLVPEDLMLKPDLFKHKCLEAFVLHKLCYCSHARLLPWRNDVKRNLAYLNRNMLLGDRLKLKSNLSRISINNWLQIDMPTLPNNVEAQTFLDFVARQYQKPLCVDDLLLLPDEFMSKCVFVESFKLCSRAQPWQNHARRNMYYLYEHFAVRGAQARLAETLGLYSSTIPTWLNPETLYRMPDFDQAVALISEFTQGYDLGLTPDDLILTPDKFLALIKKKVSEINND